MGLIFAAEASPQLAKSLLDHMADSAVLLALELLQSDALRYLGLLLEYGPFERLLVLGLLQSLLTILHHLELVLEAIAFELQRGPAYLGLNQLLLGLLLFERYLLQLLLHLLDG